MSDRIINPMALWGKALSDAEMWALIGAAGELLEKLEACEQVLAQEGGHEGGLFLEEIRATIAKAKGGKQ